MSIELTNLEASRMFELLSESAKLRARIAELERVLKSVAEYINDGECYCLDDEEDMGRNPCWWCVANRKIKSVLGKEAKP